MTKEEAIKILKYNSDVIHQTINGETDPKEAEALGMAIKALESQRWISVEKQLPMCEQEVLICAIRKTFDGKIKTIITTAMYEDGTMLEINSKWRWVDVDYERWDEEEDCGVVPKGWWEYRHYNPDEVYNNLVDDFIAGWMPLPEPLEPDKAESEDKE